MIVRQEVSELDWGWCEWNFKGAICEKSWLKNQLFEQIAPLNIGLSVYFSAQVVQIGSSAVTADNYTTFLHLLCFYRLFQKSHTVPLVHSSAILGCGGILEVTWPSSGDINCYAYNTHVGRRRYGNDDKRMDGSTIALSGDVTYIHTKLHYVSKNVMWVSLLRLG